MKKKRTDRLCKKTDDRSEKNLKEKKKKNLLSSDMSDAKQHKEKIIILKVLHATLFIITIIISTHNKNETDFREKEEKSRSSSISRAVEYRGEQKSE